MKKITLYATTVITVGLLCYLGLSGYVWYYDKQRSKKSDVQASVVGENNKILGYFREKGCDYCHTPSAEFWDYDIQLGYKSIADTGRPTADTPVPQSELNKIEWVMQRGVSDKERTDILNWIADQRERNYASADTDAAHRNEPVQPIPRNIPVDAKKVDLGFRLYHDERLSGDSTISCAHCHAINAGGVDGRKTSIGVGGAVGPINAPTVFNSVFNIEQFWDGRAATLQEQAGGPPLNPIEMASKSWDEIISKLDKDPVLKKDFQAVYPQGFTGENITDAIAEFEKTLITPDSAFDKWLRGDENALTEQQKHGYQLFKENKCATCHGGIILGGRSFEPLGLKRDFNFGEITAADIGRMNVTKEVRDKLRQKVPGLRNVALTAPYFHRGDVPTLDGAVKLMLRYQVGTDLPQNDIDDIVAFLESLTGVYTPYQPEYAQ